MQYLRVCRWGAVGRGLGMVCVLCARRSDGGRLPRFLPSSKRRMFLAWSSLTHVLSNPRFSWLEESRTVKGGTQYWCTSYLVYYYT